MTHRARVANRRAGEGPDRGGLRRVTRGHRSQLRDGIGMTLLLDTHVLLWWLDDPGRLSEGGEEGDPGRSQPRLCRRAVAWEITIKKALGKLDAPDDLEDILEANRLPTPADHDPTCASRYGLSPITSAIPFDRIPDRSGPARRVSPGEPRFGDREVSRPPDRRLSGKEYRSHPNPHARVEDSPGENPDRRRLRRRDPGELARASGCRTPGPDRRRRRLAGAGPVGENE